MQEKSEDNSKQLINSKEQLDNKSSLDNNIDDNASINGMETTTQQKQPKNTENKIKNYKEHCFLFDTEYKNFKTDGKDVEYLIAKVTNIDDKIIDVVVKPEFREELEKCDVGTELIIDLEEFNENIVSKNIEFVQKIPKKVAADQPHYLQGHRPGHGHHQKAGGPDARLAGCGKHTGQGFHLHRAPESAPGRDRLRHPRGGAARRPARPAPADGRGQRAEPGDRRDPAGRTGCRHHHRRERPRGCGVVPERAPGHL